MLFGRDVSIRFEVRGGFRRNTISTPPRHLFQSALRFAVVSDLDVSELPGVDSVSIRFEVRGGFRLGRV